MSIENIVISTQQSNHNEWMAFACWYSIHRNLPEAKVAAIFPRSYKHHQFNWLNKCHIPYLAYTAEGTVEQAVDTLINSHIVDHPTLIVKDYMMIIREIDIEIKGIVKAEDLPIYNVASSEEMASIINYTDCGKFNLQEWENTEQKHPFYRTNQLIARKRTVNEQRIFQLWRQMGITFDFINR